MRKRTKPRREGNSCIISFSAQASLKGRSVVSFSAALGWLGPCRSSLLPFDFTEKQPTMSDKASVSKELNAKHTKILEGLLKLPENKECADCRGRAPRWASINLGIFICLQCSGIHRSLGVHISKVRSTTLDTWLPEQIAFMQCVGNEKSNNYWEAELPASEDRSDIAKFIRTKYQERKWASRYAPQPEPSNMVIETSEVESKAGIPRKARKYSMEEGAFGEQLPPVPTTTRSRGASLDTMDEILNLPPKHGLSSTTSVKQNDAAKDLFSLLYAPEAKQDRTIVPPSRWATFE